MHLLWVDPLNLIKFMYCLISWSTLARGSKNFFTFTLTLSLLAFLSACNMLLYITYFTDIVLVGMATSVKKQPSRKIKEKVYVWRSTCKKQTMKAELQGVPHLFVLTFLCLDLTWFLFLLFMTFLLLNVTQCPGLQPPAQVHGWGH